VRTLLLNSTPQAVTGPRQHRGPRPGSDPGPEGHGVTTELVRVADYEVRPEVSSDEGLGDQCSQLPIKILASEILVMASPTWLGQPSSRAKRVLGRMDAMISETDDRTAQCLRPGRGHGRDRQRGRRPPRHQRARRGAGRHRLHRPRSVLDLLHMGPGPGPSYLEIDQGHAWSASAGRAAAGNLVAVAGALQATPCRCPPDSSQHAIVAL
jgi:hypothetical protein